MTLLSRLIGYKLNASIVLRTAKQVLHPYLTEMALPIGTLHYPFQLVLCLVNPTPSVKLKLMASMVGILALAIHV